MFRQRPVLGDSVATLGLRLEGEQESSPKAGLCVYFRRLNVFAAYSAPPIAAAVEHRHE